MSGDSYNDSVRYVWLTIVVLSGVPLTYVALLANPLVVLVLGVDGWRERLLGLAPYRRWIVLSFVAFCISTVVFTVRY